MKPMPDPSAALDALGVPGIVIYMPNDCGQVGVFIRDIKADVALKMIKAAVDAAEYQLLMKAVSSPLGGH